MTLIIFITFKLFDNLPPEVGSCGATVLLAIALAPQLFLNGCADACAASILAILSASAIQIQLGMIVFQSNVIKV